ncbi:MAG: ATP-binding cassette domain-containing protein [Peptococcaceae bacterium]|nr:ATP-binding cassette domain-containing protein [Peptococcaceae bacterium]MBO5114706.1 ATP-binding cassette domain-containing protein [Peptococcaceae bacterium]MBO5301981.1 ATP-binding cassette domain-containing protein [Peptococcaceae bacterium]MBO5366859.1 ATP-binding cassette domain-containing protein [Peptococcaceae bacterium]
MTMPNESVTEYVIEAKDLGFQVGRQKLLSGINLRIKKGEHWLVYGMNGCGKTTLMSILAGFRQQTQGELQVFGEPFTNENVLAQRKRIGWVSSSFFDLRYRHEPVLDIVLSGKFGTYGTGWDITSADHNHAVDLLTAFGLEDKRYLSYDRLSKGQRQNVLLARAFMNRPELLLLDEPYSGLDVLAKARFMELLNQLMQQEDLTVLFVSHEINDVREQFTHTIMLRNGRLFAQGRTEELFQEKQLSSFFQQPVQMHTVQQTTIAPADNHRKLSVELFR